MQRSESPRNRSPKAKHGSTNHRKRRAMPKGAIPWTTIKRLYCVDGLSAPRIEQHPDVTGTVTRQAIKKRADREGWLTPAEHSQAADSQRSDLPEVTPQMRKELRTAHGAVDHKLRALFELFSQGVADRIAAASVGISRQRLNSWRELSPSFAAACEQCFAADAIGSIKAIKAAQDRGDWKAAERKLAVNRLAKEDWSQASSGGSGGPQMTIVFQLPRDGKEIKEVKTVEPEKITVDMSE